MSILSYFFGCFFCDSPFSFAETKKQLSAELESEVSGEFSKALLLLAKVQKNNDYLNKLPHLPHDIKAPHDDKNVVKHRIYSLNLRCYFQGERDWSGSVDVGKAKEDAKVEHIASMNQKAFEMSRYFCATFNVFIPLP